MTHQDQKDEARHPEADIVPKSDSTILVKTYVTNLSAQETFLHYLVWINLNHHMSSIE